MMRPVDYLIDLKDVLLRRYPWHQSEVQGLAQRVARNPLCYVGIHSPKYGEVNYSYWEPTDWGWYCRRCDKEPCLPVRYAVQGWLMERKPIGDLVYWWAEKHDPELRQ